MDERQFGGKANSYLLMSSERVVPGREAEEHDATLFEKVFDMKHKILFVRRLDMFYNIMNEYEVELILSPYSHFLRRETGYPPRHSRFPDS